MTFHSVSAVIGYAAGNKRLKKYNNKYKLKPEELNILGCGKGKRSKAEAFFTAKNVELRGF